MPSLRAVYAMTFSEYLLRVEGWHRQQKRQLYRDRRTWYTTLIGPHYDPIKLPRTEAAYLPIEGEDNKSELTDEARDLWLRKVEKYKAKQRDGKSDD